MQDIPLKHVVLILSMQLNWNVLDEGSPKHFREIYILVCIPSLG